MGLGKILNDTINITTQFDFSGIYGAGPHSDYGFITLLATNDVSGLEIFVDDAWLPVKPIPGFFIVNLG